MLLLFPTDFWVPWSPVRYLANFRGFPWLFQHTMQAGTSATERSLDGRLWLAPLHLLLLQCLLCVFCCTSVVGDDFPPWVPLHPVCYVVHFVLYDDPLVLVGAVLCYLLASVFPHVCWYGHWFTAAFDWNNNRASVSALTGITRGWLQGKCRRPIQGITVILKRIDSMHLLYFSTTSMYLLHIEIRQTSFDQFIVDRNARERGRITRIPG